MTVEDIIREIEERKNRQIEQIRSEYEGLLEKAKQENEERKRRAVEEYEKRKSQQGSMKREQILDEALVQARRMVSEKKDELVKQALARALFYVDNIRASRDYPKLLRKMVDISRSLIGPDAEVLCAREDFALLKGVVTGKLTEHPGISAGIIARSPDGSLELNLTASRIREDLKPEIEKHLFMRISGE